MNYVTHRLSATELCFCVQCNLLSTNHCDVGNEIYFVLNRFNYHETRISSIVLDLRKCQMVDSDGMRLIQGVLHESNKNGLSLIIKISSENLKRSFCAIGMDKWVRMEMDSGISNHAKSGYVFNAPKVILHSDSRQTKLSITT